MVTIFLECVIKEQSELRDLRRRISASMLRRYKDVNLDSVDVIRGHF